MRSFPLLTLMFSLILTTSYAQQQHDLFRYFDAAWKPSKEKKAIYLLRIHIEDSCRQYSYYNMYGPLVRIETYLDEKASIRHGLFAWYNENGMMDSSGYYYKGMPDKTWMYPDENGKIRSSKYYDKGVQLSESSFMKKERAREPIDPAYPDLSRETPESYFPGGASGWRQYLEKNFKYPDRAIKNYVQGMVLAIFLVDVTGKIQDLQILKSVELSLDDQTLWMFRNSPDWIPAIRFGRKVRSYKQQPVIFKLEASNTR
jgi:periplasmic protein TonB